MFIQNVNLSIPPIKEVLMRIHIPAAAAAIAFLMAVSTGFPQTPTPTPRSSAEVVWANWTSLAARWSFDEGEGTVAYDSAGGNHGNFASKMDSGNWAEGTSRWGYSSVRFTGQTEQYIDTGTWWDKTNDLTIIGWVYPVGNVPSPEYGEIVQLWEGWDGSGFRVHRHNTRGIRALFNVDGNFDIHDPITTLGLDSWHFWAWSFKDGESTI